MDRKEFIFTRSHRSPLQADFDGGFPGLKAWAVLLDRFAVRSNVFGTTQAAFALTRVYQSQTPAIEFEDDF
jgi:hypothetical protein